MFAVLCFLCTAAPILGGSAWGSTHTASGGAKGDEAEAGDQPGEAPVPIEPEAGEVAPGNVSPPSAELVQEDIEATERAEAAKERWLESEEAIRQREESRRAFASISADEAEGLLAQFFPEELAALNADPARLLTDLENVEPLGTNAALVSDEQGERSLLESSIPVQSEVGQGSKQPLDLNLERSGDSFTPKNPLAELSLPDSALGSVRLASGLRFDLPASADSQARPVEDVGLIYPETEKATDTILAPVAGGVEVFQQLRSPDSPEALRFDLGLPPETLLAPTEAGGAEVISASKERIVSIPPPWAVDAQGSPVSVAMSVEGSSLTLEVAHRSRDLAYPILVDPAYIEENAPFGNWGPAWNDQYEMWKSPVLGIRAKGSSYSYAGGSFGHWVWTTHGATTYISAAGFGGDTFTLPGNCATEQPTNQPHGYAGLFNPGTGTYVGAGLWYGGSSWTSAYWATGGTPGVRQAVVGIGVGASAVQHKCAITFEVAGVTVQQKDPEAPTINWVGGATGNWVKDISVTTYVSDPGLGVTGITLSPEGAAPHTIGSCAGTYVNQCPAGREANFGVGYFAEGERGASISAYDPLGASPNSDPNHVSASYQWTTRLDRTKPDVELEGQLTEAIEEAEEAGEESAEEVPQLRLPVYNLKIAATDKATTGNPKTEAKARRSGVKDIAVFVDGEEKEVPWSPQGCSGPEYSCPMEEVFPVYLNTLNGDPVHKLKVVVEDQVGNAKEEEREFEYIPATGMKDEYVMHYFPLPDGTGNEGEEEHPSRPELAVNVVNGNLVFRQKDVDVEGPAVDLEVERFYNSQLPEEDNTEWGDGWTLAQTPQLEPEETEAEVPPQLASVLRTTGAVESAVQLPTEPEGEHFDPKLQAVVTKEADGGYEVEDQTGETDATIAFDKAGKVKELRTSGSATIDYDYEEGDLAAMAVEDPATATYSEPEPEVPTYQSSFGTEGSGDGQFKRPADVAIDAQRNIYVVDKENNRIEKFDGAGNFLKAFGTKGSGDGQFNTPTAIAVDPEGDVWVADQFNSRVQQFSKEGAFISKFGSYGSEAGKLGLPQGLAIDAAGNLYVADALPSRIQKFKPNGEFLELIAASGSGAGQVSSPAGLDIDAEGNLWVADRSNNRAQAFNPAGEFLRQWQGSGAAAFKPFAIDVDAKGTVWVGDTEHHRVEGFTPYGALLAEFGEQGSGDGQLNLSKTPSGLIADPSGDIWVTDTGNQRVGRWLAGGDFKYDLSYQSSLGAEGTGDGQFKHPADLAIDAQRNIYVVDKENNRVEKFDGAGNFLKAFGAEGTGDGQFKQPTAIAIDPEGDIWVVDRNNYRVQQFNANGEFVSKFGSLGTGNGQFFIPEGIAIDSAGNVYVGDLSNRVQKLKANGEFVKVIAPSGTGPGQVKAPAGLDFDAEGNLWVADRNNNRVQAFNPAGEFLRQWKGSGAAAFKPYGIDVDANGAVWVTDTDHHRIEGFTPYGDLLTQFGSSGSGDGQLNLSAPVGLEADLVGRIWIADGGNHRVQRWLAEQSVKYDLSYQSSLGTEGSGDGQFKHPADLAIDAQRNIYVLDKENNRVQKFDGAGNFLKAFGSQGSGDGQLNQPSAIAIDPEGDIWVADTNNSRVQQFSKEGVFISKFGSAGAGNGQLFGTAGLAIDAAGNIYVGDLINRIQKFKANGEFVKVIAPSGTGPGQVKAPAGLDFDAEGNLWVADRNNNRIQAFNPAGEFLRQWKGSGAAAFKPYGIDVDSNGTVWVADTEHHRIEGFTPYGDLLTEFGESGSGDGQLNLSAPVGLEADLVGDVWVVDGGNHRLQKWIPTEELPPLPGDGDASVQVELDEGLVEVVDGPEAGETTYSHDDALLTAVDGEQGETEYEYDKEDRLAKVTLPNGTWGEVEYDSAGRVKKVTVDPAGGEPAKATYFIYKEEPRRTTVDAEGEPAIVYEIGADGSVLKWWNTESPPEVQLTGSLYQNRETAGPIETGDYELDVFASHVEGIASIEIVANGNVLVSEKTCDEDLETEEVECDPLDDLWVTNTGDWAPGIVYVEVIVTNTDGKAESERFWVNIPYTPPPDPEAEEAAKFADVLKFREEHGLDLDLKGNEKAIAERVWNSIGDWNTPHTPAGEVARASWERWGVPLRAAEVAELDYRLSYAGQDIGAIDAWARAQAPGTYAGTYIDEAAGGLIRVGFTANQGTQIANLKAALSLIAPQRVTGFAPVPLNALSALSGLQSQVMSISSSNPQAQIHSAGIDILANRVRVGSSNTTAAKSLLDIQLGAQAPITVYHSPPIASAGLRARITGKIHGGERITAYHVNGVESGLCTSSVGAYEYATKPADGSTVLRLFALTAAHCGPLNGAIVRGPGPTSPFKLSELNENTHRIAGYMKRHGYAHHASPYRPLDAAAVRLTEHIEPRRILDGGEPLAVRGMSTVEPGMILCHAGATTWEEFGRQKTCGPVIVAEPVSYNQCEVVENGECVGPATPLKQWSFDAPIEPGDSGGPVWIEGTNLAVGINSSGGSTTYMAPIAPDPLYPDMASVFSDSSMGSLDGLTTSLSE